MDKTITVFRCGAMAPALHRPHIKASFDFFDSFAPEGRVLRSHAIFASPERAALSPWIDMKLRKKARAAIFGSPNPHYDQDTSIRHLELHVDEYLFVYNADVFGRIHLDAFENNFNPELVDASPYWETGIRLSEWKRSNLASTSAAESWEVLLSTRHLRTVKLETIC